ncbi:MAG: glycine cleavage system protein H [Planctomycetaceae bacterium]
MAEDRLFMMGKFEARIPGDRFYAENHLWLQKQAEGYRVGFTSYSVRLLQDVYFLDWTIDPGTEVREKQQIGEIESSKALSTLYAPFAGTILTFNEDLLNDPSAINTDNYGAGWLFEMTTDAKILNADEYVKVLDAGWEKTQQHLKGQLN